MRNTFIHAVARLDRVGRTAVRLGIVVVFLWIGGLKFFPYEADGIVPFVSNSPFMSFFYSHPKEYKTHINKEGELLQSNRQWNTENNTYGFSNILGTVLVVLALGVAGYKLFPLASMIASLLIFVMTLGTLSFLITTPESWVSHSTDADWGFPFLSGRGRLVIKDMVILGGAILTASESAMLYLKRKKKEITNQRPAAAKQSLPTAIVIACLLMGAMQTAQATGLPPANNELITPKIDTLNTNTVHFRRIKIGGVNIFYREAGSKDRPVILLMHGYPSSSFMFRNLIPILSEYYYVIAPDMPGFGFSDFPARERYVYSFDNIATTMQGFIDSMGLKRFAIYIFDYGAPIGLRLAIHNPERITAIISQNGNAYEQGLLDWSHGRVKAYWADPSPKNRAALKDFFASDATHFQYQEGVSDTSLVAPEGIFLDQQLMNRPGNIEMQLDLLLDYRNNIKLYPAFQQYFRDYKPPILAVWGNKDPYFSPPGAEGFKKDDPNTTVKFYNTGHFALETHCNAIGQDILGFMKTLPL